MEEFHFGLFEPLAQGISSSRSLYAFLIENMNAAMENPQQSLFQIEKAASVSGNSGDVDIADERDAYPGISIHTNPQTGHADALTQLLKLRPMLLDFLENGHANSLASEHCSYVRKPPVKSATLGALLAEHQCARPVLIFSTARGSA